MNKEEITTFIQNESGIRIVPNNELSTGKVIINNIEITSIEDWGKVVDSLTKLQQENQKYKEVIDKAIDNIDLVIELIKQQPTEDDSWILDRLNAFKIILKEVE